MGLFGDVPIRRLTAKPQVNHPKTPERNLAKKRTKRGNGEMSCSSWWFFINPLEKYAQSSKYHETLPRFGLNIPNIFELPPAKRVDW